MTTHVIRRPLVSSEMPIGVEQETRVNEIGNESVSTHGPQETRLNLAGNERMGLEVASFPSTNMLHA